MKLAELPEGVKKAIDAAIVIVLFVVATGVYWLFALAADGAGWGSGWIGELWKGITGG